MAYNIRHIDNARLQKKKYFFDANLWLTILRPKINPSNRDQKYLNFFKRFCESLQKPKIVLTSLVLSEVINRYLRQVGMIKYAKSKGIENVDSSFYKLQYRPSLEFVADYSNLCEDIKAYQDHYELVNDGLANDIKQKHILTSPPSGLDFNDLYFYMFAKKNNYSIVTDDKDFFVQDVEILTYNQQLIDRANVQIAEGVNPPE
jgi:predicted nucleic acid-binding protein